MKITQSALEKLGVKRTKYKDDIDESLMNYEYQILTKSNLKITVEFVRKNTAGKWVDSSCNCYLDNGQNLYQTKDCETLQDLFQLLRILGSSNVDLEAFESLLLTAKCMSRF